MKKLHAAALDNAMRWVTTIIAAAVLLRETDDANLGESYPRIWELLLPFLSGDVQRARASTALFRGRWIG